jgi:hypothetical protein
MHRKEGMITHDCKNTKRKSTFPYGIDEELLEHRLRDSSMSGMCGNKVMRSIFETGLNGNYLYSLKSGHLNVMEKMN